MLSFKPPCQFRYGILIGCLALASVACEWNLFAQTNKPAAVKSSSSHPGTVKNRIWEELYRSTRYSPKKVESKPNSPRRSATVEERIQQELLRRRSSQSRPQTIETPVVSLPAQKKATSTVRLPPANKKANPPQVASPIRPVLPTPVRTVSNTVAISQATNFANNASGQDSPNSLILNPPGTATDEIQDLNSFVNYALANHPALAASKAEIQATKYKALQAGLSPNPQLGLYIDELGNENDPGLWGAYIQKKHLRGNKRAIARKVQNREVDVRKIKNDALKLSITTEIKRAFYQVLIAQEKLELANQLAAAQQQAVSQSRQLFDAGETPKTDLLQTELQAQRALVLVGEARVIHKNSWRQLAASIGSPNLEQRTVLGTFEPLAQPLAFDYWQQKILENSPTLLAAEAEVERVRTTIDQEIARSVPDYQTQISLGRDSNSNHFFTGVQLQVPLQIYDRNQGSIAAAKSNLVAAQNRVRQIQLRLTKQLAMEFQKYELSLVKIDLYQSELIPNAEKTLDLIKSGYPAEVSFLKLVSAQQTLIDLTIDYLNAIEELWKTRLRIEGLLQDNSLNP